VTAKENATLGGVARESNFHQTDDRDSATTAPAERAPLPANVLAPLIARVRTDVSAVKRNGETAWTREPITDGRLLEHLNGRVARGVCPIKAGESTTMVGLLDLDSHKGETPWPGMVVVAAMIFDALEVRGMRPIAFRSSGGRGIHLILLWDEPQDAYSVRQFLRGAVGALGYRDGAGGVAANEIEVFPKQDCVKPDRWGNQFILPLAGASEPLEPMLGLEPAGREWALVMDWPSSPPVPVVEKPARPPTALLDDVDAQMACRALMAIPNDAENGADRDEWFRILCAFKEAVGDDGWDAAYDWSAKHGSHADAKFDKVWDSITVGKEEGTPAAYLFAAAQQHGFTEHIAADFVAIDTPSGQHKAPPLPNFTREKNGQILATRENLTAAIRRPDLCRYRLRHDTFRDEVMLARPDTEEWRALRDVDYHELCMTLERGGQGFKPVPKELMRDTVAFVAAESEFDSAAHWLGMQFWDGIPRVEGSLVAYFGAEDTPYTRAVGRYLWSALAGRILRPGVKVDMVPVAVGPQGAGKSSVVAAIVPAAEFFLELDLGGKEDDIARLMRGKLVVELGELRGLRVKEAEHLKAFITRAQDKWIPKYKELEVAYARRSVFFGTTNKEEFLADDTGHRRWLPFKVTQCDPLAMARDRGQLWAEGHAIYLKSGVVWQEAESLAKAEHRKFEVHDPWEEIVTRWIESPDDLTGAKPGDGVLTAGDALRGAIGMPPDRITHAAKERMSTVFKALGFESCKVRVAGKQARGYRRPT